VFWGCRRFLVELGKRWRIRPATPAELTVDHLERYWRQTPRAGQRAGTAWRNSLRRKCFGQMPPGVIAEAVDAWLHRRRSADEYPTVPGYSDREFEAIMGAARSEVAAIRSRLKARPTPTPRVMRGSLTH